MIRVQSKVAMILSIIFIYIVAGVFLRVLVLEGYIAPLPSEDNVSAIPKDVSHYEQSLLAAQGYMKKELIREDGHVYLYELIGPDASQEVNNPRATNSEAMSYALLIAAQGKDKELFDTLLTFTENNMLHPAYGYMMWRVEENGSVITDGVNVATDADLRALRALALADEQWGDTRYKKTFNTIANGLEQVGMTSDNFLAPYGGERDGILWSGEEVWLSYADFQAFNKLAERRGGKWPLVSQRMKSGILKAQIANGLYNTELTENRVYGNNLDGGDYSINSLWIMVRAAESDDAELQESAQKSLNFYKKKFAEEGRIYSSYSSSGLTLSSDDPAWAYALVGRAATALGEEAVADLMLRKLVDKQITDVSSTLYGAITEGAPSTLRVGQFTMQESILTIQDFLTYAHSLEEGAFSVTDLSVN